MEGKKTRYHKYKSQGSGNVIIPISMAQGLKWQDGDEIVISFEIINGKKGLFLHKPMP